MYYVIVQIRAGGLPPISKHHILLKLSPISRENLGKIWPNLCNFLILRFPNIVHGTDLSIQIRVGGEAESFYQLRGVLKSEEVLL